MSSGIDQKFVIGDIESTIESSLQTITYVPKGKENGPCEVPLILENDAKKPDTLFLYFTVLTGTLLFFVSGATLVWTSPVIPMLRSNNTEINPMGYPISTTEVSLIAGVPSLTMLFGSVILARVSELVGRKRCLQIIGLGLFSSTLLIAFSPNVLLIVLFRSVLYIFYIGTLTVLPVYITEICEDHNRAKFGCLMGAFLPFGNLYTYILGSFCNVRYLTVMIAAPLLFFLAFFNLAPETPVYLLSKGRKDQCIKAIHAVRKNKTSREINEEFVKIEGTIQSSVSAQSNFIALFKTREARWGMLLAISPVIIQNLSGVTVIMTFLAPLFNSAGTSLSGNTMAIIVGSIKVCSFIFTSTIIEKTGRRRMLLISTLGTGIPLFVLGIFFYLKQQNSHLLPYIQWLPLACVISNVVMYSLGLGSIPMAIMGEYFPIELRSLALSFIMIIFGLIMFVTTFTYPYIDDYLGVHWCVWMYSGVCFLGFIFMYLVIPETKGKTLNEIQEYLKTR
uniref:Major facilitator superfamily protein n=1 Tax=Phyllotreta armoraciae TaxID=1553667 RepID=A0A858Z6Y9_9CUCU|nr:major facilitator superfamily protein [Phyllotreta armoraciae]